MKEKPRLGVTGAFFLKPLLEGLDSPGSPFDLTVDIPASLALTFSDRPDTIRGAFLSPIDYARHGGNYRIVPQICVSSSLPTGAARLYVNEGTKDITRLAVDIRVTSEIILAKIILLEKFPNLSADHKGIHFLPMMPDIRSMLQKADAALVANLDPAPEQVEKFFCLDLIEEWTDLTGLPYVHGFWVVRAGGWSASESAVLLSMRNAGMSNLASIASRFTSHTLPEKTALEFLKSFKYDFSQEEEESVSEFLRYSFFHGVLGDIPDVTFFSDEDSVLPVN